jgi:uncharacterized damage-inducible protein DinB
MSQRALLELLRGHGAHTDALECFRGLSVEVAGRRVDAFPHSIWQQLGHLNYWMRYEVDRIGGSDPEYPEHAALSWSADPAPRDGAAWDGELRVFETLLGELSRVAQSEGAELQRSIASPHSSHEGVDTTILGILWQTAVHNSYHLGQVAMLRRMLGAWPPPAGGDTW